MGSSLTGPRCVVTGRTVISSSSSQRALGGEVEPPDRADIVAPPLQPRRRRHAEAVHVEDAAPHAELRDLGHRRHPLVAHLLEGACATVPASPARRPTASRSRSRCSAAGTIVRSAVARAVVTRTRSRPCSSASMRLGPLAGDLVVRLVLAQRLTLGIERDVPRRGVGQRSASQRSASAGVGATTVRSRCGSLRASHAARTAPLEPGSPPRRSAAPRAGSRSASSIAAGDRSKASSTGLSFNVAASARSPGRAPRGQAPARPRAAVREDRPRAPVENASPPASARSATRAPCQSRRT